MGIEAETIAFALGSCQYPPGLLDREVAEASYRRLGLRLDEGSGRIPPRFMLLVGDQVYVDATGGLFDPTEQYDRYVRPYERLYASPAVKNVLRRLPVYSMLDDHEIEDNWEPIDGDASSKAVLDRGREAYLQFQRGAEPRTLAAVGKSAKPLWHTFAGGPFPFFVADTRTERTPRTAETIDTARIMSETQFDTILHWLSFQKNDVPKFIASPAILLPRRLRATRGKAGALRSDAWEGYPYSFHRLLAYLAEKEIRNVVFLSGDEHLSCVAEASIKSVTNGKSASILSIHSSALYAPYPFANSIPADFDDTPKFQFDLAATTLGAQDAWACNVGGSYECRVKSEFVAGDGFAVIRVLNEGGKWKVCCEFDRAGDSASRQIDRWL